MHSGKATRHVCGRLAIIIVIIITNAAQITHHIQDKIALKFAKAVLNSEYLALALIYVALVEIDGFFNISSVSSENPEPRKAKTTPVTFLVGI